MSFSELIWQMSKKDGWNLWTPHRLKPGLCPHLADLCRRSRLHASLCTSVNCLWRHQMLFVSCTGKGPQMKWKYWLCVIEAQQQGYISSIRVNCHLNSLSTTMVPLYNIVLKKYSNSKFVFPCLLAPHSPPLTEYSSHSEMTPVSSKMNFLWHQSPK